MSRPLAHPFAYCRVLFGVVAKSLKLVKLLSQQLPTFLLFCEHQSVVFAVHFLSSSNINFVGAIHTHYIMVSMEVAMHKL